VEKEGKGREISTFPQIIIVIIIIIYLISMELLASCHGTRVHRENLK